SGGEGDQQADGTREHLAVPGVGTAVAHAVDDIGVFGGERVDEPNEVAAVELPVAVDVHQHVGVGGEPGTVGRERGRAVAAVQRLHVVGRVGDGVEHRGRGIRGALGGGVEGDVVGQGGHAVTDLVGEALDALGLVVGGHDDGEVAKGHGVLGVAEGA